MSLADLQIRVRRENYFLYFSNKTDVMGTQKNRLNEMVLLSTQNTCLKDLGQFPIQSAQILTACG